ncbi:MAG: hypothetical protein C0621_01525 [Desulfuromonas sp.]|nr:MAG: hypothetical protein C0621_01525 [Desulfuromonas sp.]
MPRPFRQQAPDGAQALLETTARLRVLHALFEQFVPATGDPSPLHLQHFLATYTPLRKELTGILRRSLQGTYSKQLEHLSGLLESTLPEGFPSSPQGQQLCEAHRDLHHILALFEKVSSPS